MDNLIVKTTNKEEAISEIIKIYQKEDVVLQELVNYGCSRSLCGIVFPD